MKWILVLSFLTISSAMPAIGQSVPGKGSIASAPTSGKVGLMVLAGPLAGQTIDFAITPATKFTSDGRQCDPYAIAG